MGDHVGIPAAVRFVLLLPFQTIGYCAGNSDYLFNNELFDDSLVNGKLVRIRSRSNWY